MTEESLKLGTIIKFNLDKNLSVLFVVISQHPTFEIIGFNERGDIETGENILPEQDEFYTDVFVCG